MTEKIYFHNSKKQKLCGVLEEPKQSKEEIVILVHGYSSNKEGKTTSDMAKELTTRGMNSFRIDLDGCGESEGYFAEQTVTSMADDIVSAIKFVESLGYENIDLMGASGGAISSMVAVLQCPQIRKLALKSPTFDYVEQRRKSYGEEKIKKWKEKGHLMIEKSRGTLRVDYSFFEDAHNHIMYDKVKNISCPVLMIHGDADEVVDIKQSKKAVNNFPNVKLIIFHGANHNLGLDGDRSLSNKLFADWLEGKELIVSEPHYFYN
ncbi:alpha/beta hydrolase [Candidatus Woesearchaeota archaeon]|jgi:hypothetical protein|nr:alpha/beta hydrolase [Candidatus Woesearchaeota archaeon]MBT4110300.1 alpha/beta hydrolase [Candidatus Woesearchaeota archaeon]MBT4336176.1 alpha/beta hydrolase [Candidatus Woesearchaeota archaeon]MBT4468845.1 alpha/beta hydrolase [Candidatus Woesearchaeota archaeon]MBT6744836.1 alpha/beta hydrolase [Candidatus Woesearchaeota archaeon]